MATSLNINPNESRLAEIKTENSRVVDLAKTVFDKGDLYSSISYDEQIFIINNAELFIEAFNLISDIDAYKELASFILPYNDLMNKMNESQYYSTVTSTIASYETALAEYNAKVAAYDQAVKNREMTEAERVVKLEEAIKELNTKTTELGLGNGYANFSQVLGSLKGRAIAIGNQAYVSGDEAVGVGYGNTVLGSRSNVVGTHNNVTTANNNVMGNDNNVTVSDGNVIVGNNITFAQGVTTSGNIALGTNTVISAPVPTASVEIQGVTHNFAGTTPTSVLSIANEGNERQIQNVAAGRVTNTSTDAINGSQLYAVVEALNAIQTINITGGDNVQATVSADKGITITETNNANGTKNYAVSAKLGKGLKVDENGAIAATAQPINGGAGVSITTNAQDEAVVNVAGVTTTTDDGKSYARSDLTKPVGVKGDGKNIRTSTTANGDVQVKLADDIQVNSVAIHNGPTINQQGINANNTRITNVQDGIAPTDAVNVRQLNQQGNIINQRIDNLADNVKKNKKRNDAGIASTAAMANIPQVMLAGKSGVGVGVGHRSGQNAIAVGYSRASDNAKHIIKLSAGLDTQSKATFGAGYMYQW
ncbi:YadA family autotransporter adhesin [Actinobacillus porcinus]|uniref:YadA family autotransporter adhesin n=1 Tax=Actinobacillus porcinus TaxID=51048 RepID=UPI0023578301|nr:YadA-like family protein [Actinobacillus porcinus]